MPNDLSNFFDDPDFKASLARYEEMVANQASVYFDADELVDIAKYYLSRGRMKDANEAIDFALSLHPNDVDALIFRARTLAMEGKRRKALSVYGLIEDKSDREVRFLDAEFKIYDEQYWKADEILKELAEEEEYGEETLLDILEFLTDFELGEYAKQWYDQLISLYGEKKKESQRRRDVLSYYFTTFKMPEKAIPILMESVDKKPYSAQYWADLAECYTTLGEYEKAEEAYDFALAIDDKNETMWYLKANFYLNTRMYAEARDTYLQIAEITTEKTTAHLMVVWCCMEMEDYATAKKSLEWLLEDEEKLSGDERAEVYAERALWDAANDLSEEGDKCAIQALRLSPNNVRVNLIVGRFYLTEAHNSKYHASKQDAYKTLAKRHFDISIEEEEENEKAHTIYNIALYYYNFQYFEKAAEYFTMVVEDYPDLAPHTYLFLMNCYFALKNIGLFFHYLARIKSETPAVYEFLGMEDERNKELHYNEFLAGIKQKVDEGEIDLDSYL